MFSKYILFAKNFPFANNLVVATVKTTSADLMAQCVVERKSFSDIDWQRNFVFCLFGCGYLGAFQYYYQVNIFKRLFPSIETFTNKSWLKKLTDGPGIVSLCAQVMLDLGVLLSIYLPSYYVTKEFVFTNDKTQPQK